MYDMSKNRNIRHIGHFFDGGEVMNNDFMNLTLYFSNGTLFVEIDDSNAWFVDSRVSIHMSCNKHWIENFHETNNGANIYVRDDHSHQLKG